MIFYKQRNAHLKPNETINYKDIDLLRKFITDQSKIVSRRSNGLTVKQQKQLAKSIKKARILALLPFVNKD
uniref:Small ribosomal subunit protein bS18c n=1 Tax=Gracilaria tenuistipitata var. liui TaxID=285951 RepID=RR18_GRATL|nr:30S ribosomal protein S18 [Gracilaria tenuistipitata var. liui]Q6B8S1.1 RecName: Full=Small ribosomal subunit protein bS18c; AltName: Full=30S ribosomal protein S18, chloroplastic [Gracilaria tenuistipitata var. liui]AAT79714.1 30S ribosomal protein S18 [Gracilaria tenuistipitata var. liui]